jgi:transcriptional regulator of aromatic amino acid metabolism
MEDWSAVVERRPSLLLCGPSSATEALLSELTVLAPAPIYRIACKTASFPLQPRRGTVILDDLEALDEPQQKSLMSWLDERLHADIQLISLTARPLFPKVQSGLFLSALYYRLNVIYIDVSAAAPKQHGEGSQPASVLPF